MVGPNVVASSTKDVAVVEVMKRLAEWYPQDADMERRIRAVLRELPSVLSIEKVTDVEQLLASYFTDWSRSQTHNVAALVYKRTWCGSVQTQLSGTYLLSTMTCFEKGKCAKASALDTSLPEALHVEGIVQCISEPNHLVAQLAEHLNSNDCNFELISASCAKNLCVNLAPCAILKFKGLPLSCFSVGALIKFCTEINGSSSSSYDGNLSVGELMSEGEAFLKGISGLSIVLGITDMKMMQWFRITRSKVDSHLTVSKGLATTYVIESICGYLHATPSMLGVRMSLEIHRLPSSWRVVKHIGSGLTSQVYLVVSASSRLAAVKVPQPGFDLLDDIRYLEALAGVDDGVPKIHQKVHQMIALEPVGDLFSPETLGEYEGKGFRLSLAELVGMLQCAHQRGIVNMDLRPKNIMIGESLYNAGKFRLYILDWGFATESYKACPFSGSVVTASDLVLEQLSQ